MNAEEECHLLFVPVHESWLGNAGPVHGRQAIPPLLRSGPLARCPGCGTPLDGGPVLYRCQTCHHAVPAADVDTEYHVPLEGTAAA